MDLHFTPGDVFLIVFWLIGQFWGWTLLVAAVIAFFSAFFQGRWRKAGFALAILLCGYLAVFWIVVGVGARSDKADARRAQAHTESLVLIQQTPRSLGVFIIPAGTKVQWNEDEKTSFQWLDLPGETQEFGIPVVGRFSSEDLGSKGHPWHANLATAQLVDGWLCAPGPLLLTEHGHLGRCVSAKSRQMHGFEVPAGSIVALEYLFDEDGDKLVEAAPGKALQVSPLGSVVPAGYRVKVDKHGDVDTIDSYIEELGGEDWTWPVLTIHGLRVHFFVEVHYGDDESSSTGAVREKMEPLSWARVDLYHAPVCAGVQMPYDQVRLSFKDMKVEGEDPSGDGGGPRYPVASCVTTGP